MKNKFFKFLPLFAIISILGFSYVTSAATPTPVSPGWSYRSDGQLYTIPVGNTINVGHCNGCGGGPSTVVTDSSLTGNGALLTPLSLNIQTDGTLSGHGNSGSPLSVVGGTQGGGSVIASKTATTASLINTDVTSYNNGISGVGATITENINGLLPAQDGVTLLVGQRLLVKNQTTVLQNGVYVVTSLGGVGSKYILTRSTDSDSSSEFDNQLVQPTAGTLECPINQNCTEWAQTTATPVVGTDSIVYAVFTGSYVSQAVGGVQLANQIPLWLAAARVLTKGTTDFIFNPVTKSLGVSVTDGQGQIQIGGHTFGMQNFGLSNLAVGSVWNTSTIGTSFITVVGNGTGTSQIAGAGSNTFIGASTGISATTQNGLTLIGAGANVSGGTTNNSIAIGAGAVTTAPNEVVFSTPGSTAVGANHIYFGKGKQANSAQNIHLHGGDIASGNLNTTGGDLNLDSGRSTGSAIGGSVILNVSTTAALPGSTQNTSVPGLVVASPLTPTSTPCVTISNSYRLDCGSGLSGQVQVSNGAGLSTWTTPTVTTSSTYTPVATNVTNITASTPKNTTWSRVGNIVTEGGSITVTNTLAVASEVDISLGVASNLALATDLNGIVTMDSTASVNMYVKGDATNDRASIFFTSAGIGQTSTIYFTFMYQVI